MDDIIAVYETATKDFLRCFDVYWSNMLNTLDNHQAQLVSGNKLRPQICLWGYLATIPPDDVSSQSYDYIANVAVSIEMIHKASLLLDDWLDNDNERHGKPAFHTEFDPQYSVVFALNLIGYAMYRLEEVFPASITLPHHYYLCLDTIVKTINSMAKGALKELQFQPDDIFSNDKVREITQLETAEIIGNSMLLGYYAGVGENRNHLIETQFKKIGDQCGYLFQALNDLEVFESPKLLEQHKGSLNYDLLIHRKNLAITILYEVASPADRVLLKNADKDKLTSLMKKYRIVETMKRELHCVNDNIILFCAELRSKGLPAEWCEGLNWFLGYVKKFAEERLKK